MEHFRFTPALSCLLLKQYRQLSPKITPSLILTRAQQRGAARCASGAHRPGCAAGGSRREPGLPPALGRRRLRRRLPSAPSSSSRCFSPLPRCPGAGTVPGGAGRGAFTRGGAVPSRAGLCRPHPRQPRAGGAPGTMSTGMRYKSKLLNPGEAPGPEGGGTHEAIPHLTAPSLFFSLPAAGHPALACPARIDAPRRGEAGR